MYFIFLCVLIFNFVSGQHKDFDNPMFYLWILCSVISTIYTYTWDVKMDWGLFSKNSGEYSFLREEIVYDNTVSILNYVVQVIHNFSVCMLSEM